MTMAEFEGASTVVRMDEADIATTVQRAGNEKR